MQIRSVAASGLLKFGDIALTSNGSTITIDDGVGEVDINVPVVAPSLTATGNIVAGSYSKFTSYDNYSLQGNGVPSIPKVSNLTGQSASISTTNLQCTGATSICPSGVYRINVYLVVTTAGTAGTVVAAVGWNDGATVRTITPVSSIAMTAQNYSSWSLLVRSGGSAHITYSTTVSGATGSPLYSIYVTVERLQ
jgi:hypothetical protein